MLVLAVAVPLKTLQSARNGELKKIDFTTANKKMMYYGNSAVLWIMALACLLAWWLAGRSFADLGLGWGELPYSGLAWTIMAVFVLLYSLDVISEIGTSEFRATTRAQFKKDLSFLPANLDEFLPFLLLALSAGVCEEIIFRGYFINYFEWLFAGNGAMSIGLTILVPAIIFGVSHLYQGAKAVVKIIAMATMFGAFFLLTNSLWVLIFLHALVDVLGGLVSWYLLGERE